MKLQLQSAQLIQRYKRFLADVKLPNGKEFTMHCANTGAMTGCAVPDDTVWYSTSDNPKRKYACSWELTQTANKALICVNTIRANQLAEEALNQGIIQEYKEFSALKREVKYGSENSKIDFLLTLENQEKVYIEVKSVTLLQDGQGYFPDAVSTRGQKHLRELTQLIKEGHQAVLLFAVLHSDINAVMPAAHIDKKYAELLKQAQLAGVKIIAYKAKFTLNQGLADIQLNAAIPVII